MKKLTIAIVATMVLSGSLILILPGFALSNSTITSPDEGELIFGTINLEAIYIDEDEDYDLVSWAVREGTCAAGTNTVLGNVDGYNDTYSWDGNLFNATASVSTWTPGKYCFILNPREDAGAENIRLTQWFWIVNDDYVKGGGRLLEEIQGKRKDWLDISFGGAVADMGSYGLIGEWQVNFHNVNADFDKSKFHTTNITSLNFYTGNYSTCVAAMNFTAVGEWNNMPNHKMIFRAGDSCNLEADDTVRVEIFDSSNFRIYDTYWTNEFTPNSSCVGTARTELDNGNIKIEF